MESPPVLVYRFEHFIHRLGLRRLAVLIAWLNRLVFATWLPGSANIGRNFVVGYWGLGIVIHSDASIGDNCWISQNVTIGRKGSDKRVPVIGNNVYIGAGAVIVGEIEIGDNSIIGANSFLNISVPPGSLVAGVPAKIIRSINNEPREELKRARND
ncbi:MAG: serine O-acetyltransferase [FCB group bacterium]|jgi:serine O-acetyltransferase|nr:serine O-acetyltransferase [FCB group bacterium]